MKPISYIQVSAEQVVRDFIAGRVINIYVDGEFYEGMKRDLFPNTTRRKRYYTRMIRRDIRMLSKLGPLTFKSRARIP